MRCHLQISSYRIDLVSVNGPISPKQCYYEMDYSFYSFYWLDSLQIRLDHNSTYYRPLSKNSDVKPRISHCDSQNLQYKTHPEFWPSHRRIFKTSLYYKTRLILETRRYAHTGRSCDLLIFGIPEVNFLVRAFQFGMKGVLSRIYDISPGFRWIPIFVFFLIFLRVS